MFESNDAAILLSAVSLGIAGLSLGWNVYRDVVLKPRAKVSASHIILVPPHVRNTPHFKISAVNHGPGVIRLNIIRFKRSTLWQQLTRSWTHGVLAHDWENPLSGQLPKSLEVGETLDLLFPWQEDNLFQARPTHIGIMDSFGRTHWCPKKDVRKTQQKWDEAFGPQDA